jgi:hypothetical protein
MVMTTSDGRALAALRTDFRHSSTTSMPIAGTIFWSAAALLSFRLPERLLAFAVAGGSGLIFPLALLIDKLRGGGMKLSIGDNPVSANFMRGIATIGLLWPLVIIAGLANPLVIILGAAILMALVWIPYGWSADDPVGLQHALGRCFGAYAVYLLVPRPWTALAICLVVIAAYFYSFLRMRRD